MNTYRFMCDDLGRARLNREIISEKKYIWAYLQVENWLAGNHVTDLPQWMFSEGFVNDRTEKRSEIARKGGIARAAKLTSDRRSQIAKIGGLKGGRGRPKI